jgi:TATA-binding protein-associated factor Taf7
MASQQNATKKTKGCKSMLMVDFLKEQNELGDEELEELENEEDDEELENENEDQEENGENNGNDRIFISFVCFIFMRLVFRNTIGLFF